MNVKTKKNIYIYGTMIWAFIITLIYGLRFAKPINIDFLNIELQPRQSKVVFFIVMLSGTVLTAFISYQRRTLKNIIMNPLIPLGIYSVLSQFETLMLVIIYAFATLLGLYLLSILIPMVFSPKKHCSFTGSFKRINYKLKRNKFLRENTAILIVGFLIITPIIFGNFAPVKSVERIEETEITQTGESDNSSFLYEGISWENLEVIDRINVLQYIADMETEYLGLDGKLTITLAELGENTWGSYNEKNKVIYVNNSMIGELSKSEAIDTVCHECYHSYQHLLVSSFNDSAQEYKNMRMYEKAEVYKYEINNYSELKTDYYTYYNLSLEEDARSYASERTEYYMFFYDN